MEFLLYYARSIIVALADVFKQQAIVESGTAPFCRYFTADLKIEVINTVGFLVYEINQELRCLLERTKIA